MREQTTRAVKLDASLSFEKLSKVGLRKVYFKTKVNKSLKSPMNSYKYSPNSHHASRKQINLLLFWLENNKYA